LCVRCEPGEAGEAIGRIAADEAARAGRFEGYTTEADSQRKVLRDVFAKGDAWFRTGDLMRLDRQGYFTFVDRIGDTFRWKGENVATTEVAEAVACFPGVVEVMVYGVAVPGTDGKAGMAALVVDRSIDLGDLAAHLAARLPSYAQPVFLRLCETFEMTETFKQKKGTLAREGFDPAVVGDPLMMREAQGTYRVLDADTHRRIVDGDVRL
jgi:fatty-acyl-CoA synthase